MLLDFKSHKRFTTFYLLQSIDEEATGSIYIVLIYQCDCGFRQIHIVEAEVRLQNLNAR